MARAPNPSPCPTAARHWARVSMSAPPCSTPSTQTWPIRWRSRKNWRPSSMESDDRRRRLDALYPVGEKRAEAIRTRSGRPIADITLAAVVGGRLGIVDIGISAEGLKVQAEVARLAGRETLARNFERGAELVDVPDDPILAVYELL